MESERARPGGPEQEVDAERDCRARKVRLQLPDVRAWSEMAALIELPVIWQEGFRNHPKDAAGMDDDCSVVEPSCNPQRGTDAKGREEACAVLCEPGDRHFDGIQQSVLVQ